MFLPTSYHQVQFPNVNCKTVRTMRVPTCLRRQRFHNLPSVTPPSTEKTRNLIYIAIRVLYSINCTTLVVRVRVNFSSDPKTYLAPRLGIMEQRKSHLEFLFPKFWFYEISRHFQFAGRSTPKHVMIEKVDLHFTPEKSIWEVPSLLLYNLLLTDVNRCHSISFSLQSKFGEEIMSQVAKAREDILRIYISFHTEDQFTEFTENYWYTRFREILLRKYLNYVYFQTSLHNMCKLNVEN